MWIPEVPEVPSLLFGRDCGREGLPASVSVLVSKTRQLKKKKIA